MKDTLLIKSNQQQPELTKPIPVFENNQPTTVKPSHLSFKGGVAKWRFK